MKEATTTLTRAELVISKRTPTPRKHKILKTAKHISGGSHETEKPDLKEIGLSCLKGA